MLSLNDERLKDIKVIALDLDGTTLTMDGLTRRTKETLEEAIEKGYIVVIATGRPYSALPDRVKEIKGLKYIVTSNGAHIVNIKGEFLYSNYADKDAISKVRDYLMKAGYPYEVFTGGEAYVDQALWDDLLENGSTYMGYKYILRTRKPVPNIHQFFLEHIEEIEDINIHFENLEDKPGIWKDLEEIGNITVTTSYSHNIEVGGFTCSKAAALKEVCEAEKLSLSNMIAFGDSHNDMAMLQEGGIAVAMGNASDDLKDIADYVAPTNDEEGVCYTIRKFLFKDKLI